MPKLRYLRVLESSRVIPGGQESGCERRTDFWTAVMIWLNMASTLSGWCWLGVRWWDWVDITEGRNGTRRRERVQGNVASG